MVISYRGEIDVRPRKPKPQSLTVADYMARRLITFRPDQSMYEVVETLLRNKISGGPVVNDHNVLIGVISEGDCLKEVIRGKYNNMLILSGCVYEHMATNVVSISPDTNIFEAAAMFLEKRLRRFPVVKEGKLIGQISQRDVMRAVMKVSSTTW